MFPLCSPELLAMDDEVDQETQLIVTASTRCRRSCMQEEKEEEEEEEEGDIQERIVNESKKIWRITVPSIVARVTSFGSIVVTQCFIGRSSSAVNLAAYALVQTVSVRFVNGLLLGMSSATETLCGQAFGAEQYHIMGIYLQRSWIVDLITLTMLLPVFIYGKRIYTLLGEEVGVAEASGHISLWFIPFLYNYVFSMTNQMFLQTQQKNLVIAWLSAAQFAIHIPLSFLLVYKLNWGVNGAMLTLIISSWLVVFGEFIYIFGGWCSQTWKGFTVVAFHDLWPMVKLSITSGMMLCLELWYYCILVLLAGYMKNAEVEISTFSICLNINAWEFMISVGFLTGACVRVANELGRGNAKAVKFSIKVILSTSFLIGLIFLILILTAGNKIGYAFTNQVEVVESVSNLSVLLAFSVLLGSIFPVLSGVAIGAGLQSIVAVINLVSFYIVGIPIGIVLGYVSHLQVRGVWMGMMCGIMTQTTALCIMVWKTNWEKEVAKASDRLKRWFVESESADAD